MSPIVHAKAVLTALRWGVTARAMSRPSLIQVFANDAHQEERNAIGEDDRTAPAR